MVIKIFYIAVAIFAVAMVFLSLQNPYENDLFKRDINLANMQMKGIVDYEVSEKVSLKLSADTATRYSKKDEFENFKAEMVDDINHTLTSQKAQIIGDNIKFYQNAKYQNSDGLNYKSEEILYNTKKKIAKSNVPFEMTQNSDKITGKSIEYDLQKKQSKAKGVNGWFVSKD